MRKKGDACSCVWNEMQKAEIAAWVQAALKDAKISYAEASRRMNLPRDAISKVIGLTRDLSAAEMAQIAEMTGVELRNSVVDTGIQPRYVRVIGEVAAGLWRDVYNPDFEEFEFVALVDTRWPVGSVFGYVVRGESINRKAADGDRVVALLQDYAPRSLQSGDWVIAHRIRSDLRETTVKRVKHLSDGTYELWPYSDDPRYQAPLILGEHDDEAVHIVAYVLDFVSTGTKF